MYSRTLPSGKKIVFLGEGAAVHRLEVCWY